MKHWVPVILTLLCLTPVLAQTEDLTVSIKGFFDTYKNELASMAIAAVAAMGLQAALKKYSQFEGSSLNAVVMVLFIGIFILIYSTGAYQLFAGFIGFVAIAGIGSILWGTFKGMESAGINKQWSQLLISIGFFVMAGFAWAFSIDWLALILIIIGIVMLFMAFKEIKVGGAGAGTPPKINTTNPQAPNYIKPKYDIKNETDYENARAIAMKELLELKGFLEGAKKPVSEALAKLKPEGVD